MGNYEEEAVIVSVTLRHVLLAPSSLILCLMSAEGDLLAIVGGV